MLAFCKTDQVDRCWHSSHFSPTCVRSLLPRLGCTLLLCSSRRGKREKTATFIVLQDSVFNVDAFFGHKHQFGSSRAAAAPIPTIQRPRSQFSVAFFSLLFLEPFQTSQAWVVSELCMLHNVSKTMVSLPEVRCNYDSKVCWTCNKIRELTSQVLLTTSPQQPTHN